MSEFKKVLNEWRRICVKNFVGVEWTCDEKCPMRKFKICSLQNYPVPLEFGRENISEVEHEIMTWASDNPEPVYPFWYDVLMQLKVLGKREDGLMLSEDVVKKLSDTRIDPGTAKKLGIEPTNIGRES